MFARITTFTGSHEEIAAGVDTFREQVLPWMREATGFRGWIALYDPERRESIGITFWTDEHALRDDIASGAALRDEIARQAGATKETTAAYEVLAVESLELGDPP
jgi:hypothetical protein